MAAYSGSRRWLRIGRGRRRRRRARRRRRRRGRGGRKAKRMKKSVSGRKRRTKLVGNQCSHSQSFLPSSSPSFPPSSPERLDGVQVRRRGRVFGALAASLSALRQPKRLDGVQRLEGWWGCRRGAEGCREDTAARSEVGAWLVAFTRPIGTKTPLIGGTWQRSCFPRPVASVGEDLMLMG